MDAEGVALVVCGASIRVPGDDIEERVVNSAHRLPPLPPSLPWHVIAAANVLRTRTPPPRHPPSRPPPSPPPFLPSPALVSLTRRRPPPPRCWCGLVFRGVACMVRCTDVRVCMLACLHVFACFACFFCASGPAVRGPRRQDAPRQGSNAGSFVLFFCSHSLYTSFKVYCTRYEQVTYMNTCQAPCECHAVAYIPGYTYVQ